MSAVSRAEADNTALPSAGALLDAAAGEPPQEERGSTVVQGCSRTGEHDIVLRSFSALPSSQGALLSWNFLMFHSPPCPPEAVSRGFVVAGFLWRVRLYPGGDNIAPVGTLCAFLEYVGAAGETPERPGPNEVLCAFTMTLLSASGDVVARKSTGVEKSFTRALNVGFEVVARASVLAACAREDAATLRLSLRVVLPPDHRPYVLHARSAVRAALARDLGELLRTGAAADVAFLVGEARRRYAAHRAVLAARSPVFRAALVGSGLAETRTGEVVVEGVDEGAFGVFLEMLYTGASAEDAPGAAVDLYMHLMVLADRYDVRWLLELCEDRVTARLGPANVADALVLAQRCNAAGLRENCMLWIAREPAVMLRQGFAEKVGAAVCGDLLRRFAAAGAPMCVAAAAAVAVAGAGDGAVAGAAAEAPPAKRAKKQQQQQQQQAV
eukprot:m51a1_g1936 hypothetical protein (440) ;mRNA; f:919504-920906